MTDKPSRRLLVVDDDVEVLAGLEALLTVLDWEVVTAASGREGVRRFEETSPDVVLLDVMLPDLSGMDVLEQLKSRAEATPVIMMSGVGTIDVAVKAMRLGAEHFLQKPCDADNLELVLEQAARTALLNRQIAAIRRDRQKQKDLLVGASAAMERVKELVRRVAPAKSAVLIQGESGTGKGVVARMLHDQSPRVDGPFVDLNCAGLSRELLESELFGHERGAFTGAQTSKQGLLEIASGGTLFLDEIGELDVALQARLLKALEEKRFRRVGGLRDIRVDVRLIAATNRNLESEVAAGRFRSDLLFRLNVVTIELPPLRTRTEDLPLLVDALLDHLASELAMRKPSISDRALKRLAEHGWPGNVRELRNVLERAILVSNGKEIRIEDLTLGKGTPAAGQQKAIEHESEIESLDTVTDRYIRDALSAVSGNVRKAARLLEVSPTTLYSRIGKTPKDS